jgi:hypothetical protein
MKKLLYGMPFLLICAGCSLEVGQIIGPAGGYVFYDKGFTPTAGATLSVPQKTRELREAAKRR